MCKKTKTRDLISRVTRGFKPPEAAHVPSMPEVEASYQLEDYKIKSIDWPFSYLTAGTRDLVKSRVQIASHLCFEKSDSSYSILTLV